MSNEHWSHKDAWKRIGKDFLVEITRHEIERSDFTDYDDGLHRWCVYAYIYPKHPHFEKFEGGAMHQDAACALPLHCGPSYLRLHRDDDGDVTSVQVGSDYNHLHDNRFTHYATAEDAAEVFRDAERLFDVLTSMGDAA